MKMLSNLTLHFNFIEKKNKNSKKNKFKNKKIEIISPYFTSLLLYLP